MSSLSRNKVWAPRLTALFGAVAALCLLSGCATLSQGECLTANWYQIGRSDGARGFTRARLYEHRQACTEYGVWPNASAYYEGRQLGLKRYCTPRNGFRAGRDGHPYRDVCPLPTEAAFLEEYRKGKAIHEVAEDIEDVENSIDSLEARLDDDDTSNDERERIREELRDRFRELSHLNHDMNRIRERYDYNSSYLYD